MNLATAAEAVMLSHGWRRRLIALGAGAVGALALPPFGLWPILVVTFAVAVWLLDGAAGRSRLRRSLGAAVDGWFWAFGYFTAGLWWLGAAFLVEADKFLWALPFGVFGLPAVLALFPAVGFALAETLWSRRPSRALALAGALALAEFARGHLFTGFPWNSFGQALAENALFAQSAALVGLYGLTLTAIWLAAVPAALVGSGGWRAGLPSALCACLVVAAMAGFGLWRVPSGPVAEVAGVKLRIMQPNLPQDDKFHPERAREIIERYIAISDRATSPRTLGVQDVTHLIWPESAFPILVARTPAAMQRLMGFLPPNVTLLTGAARAGALMPGENSPPIYNSIHVITRDGGVVASHDKHHLVPFGEYLPGPFDALIRGVGLSQFVAIPGGFTAAPSRRVFQVPGLPPVAGTVCYEAIFPGAVMPHESDEARARPQLILNVTNDAWFGRTPGPWQHLRQARLRAIEEGVPLIRAANNGISAVVDPYGRITGSLPLDVDGVLDSGLPVAIGPTTYSRIGNSAALLGMLAFVLLAALLRRRAS
jgi:apolipoprotein N-acyltransferase